MNNKYSIKKSFLIREYVINKRSAQNIAEEIGCEHTTILRKLKHYNLKPRSLKEAAIIIKDRMVGKNNPMKLTINRKKISILLKGRKMSKSWRKKISKAVKKWLSNPEHHWAYGKTLPELSKSMIGNQRGFIHGNGNAPYPIEFNDNLKEQIRKRDKYKCQLCGKKGNHVHHIDYDKNNCIKSNLINTCMKCNCRVNGNRDYWYAYFTYKMEER